MDKSSFLRIFSKNFFMSSSTRLDRAYKNAKTISFDEDSKFIFLVIVIAVTTVLQMILPITGTFTSTH